MGVRGLDAECGFIVRTPVILIRFTPTKKIHLVLTVIHGVLDCRAQNLSPRTEPGEVRIKALQITIGCVRSKEGVQRGNVMLLQA